MKLRHRNEFTQAYFSVTNLLSKKIVHGNQQGHEKNLVPQYANTKAQITCTVSGPANAVPEFYTVSNASASLNHKYLDI